MSSSPAHTLSAPGSAQAAALFTPLQLREVTLRNRIMVAPMCQYSSQDGLANDWHLVHLGSRAVGGAAIVMTEATAVEARGRISPDDLGLWKDEQIAGLQRITRFIKDHGAVAAIQLAHAGRKASTYRPWSDKRGAVPVSEGGWQVVGPTDVAFNANYPQPQELSTDQIGSIVDAFGQAAQRSLQAGFEIVEIHAAHGYLIHEFLSPLSNGRTDEYGGSLQNRMRFGLDVARAVRDAWPDHLPLFVRISATDWTDGGWNIEQSVEFCKRLREIGVDLIDASSGGNVPNAKIPTGPGYQVPFADQIRHEAGILTAAVGLITEPQQADAIVREGQADLVALAREELRDPYWPLRAARELGVDVAWPRQYERAKA